MIGNGGDLAVFCYIFFTAGPASAIAQGKAPPL
jgi:hypothetical protein